MNNKKGFTLVEVLIVIALIALIFGLGVPGIIKLKNNMNKRTYNSKVSMIENSAKLWGTNNKTSLKKDQCSIEGNNYDCYKISVKELIEEDYLDSDKNINVEYNNPINNESMLDNCVYIYKKNNRIYSYYNSADENCKKNDDQSYNEPNSYRIRFNSNGGTGNMTEITCNIGEKCKLSTNSFLKSNYDFVGWSDSANGAIIYTDGVEVTDIANKGNVAVLYAVWSSKLSH